MRVQAALCVSAGTFQKIARRIPGTETKAGSMTPRIARAGSWSSGANSTNHESRRALSAKF